MEGRGKGDNDSRAAAAAAVRMSCKVKTFLTTGTDIPVVRGAERCGTVRICENKCFRCQVASSTVLDLSSKESRQSFPNE